MDAPSRSENGMSHGYMTHSDTKKATELRRNNTANQIELLPQSSTILMVPSQLYSVNEPIPLGGIYIISSLNSNVRARTTHNLNFVPLSRPDALQEGLRIRDCSIYNAIYRWIDRFEICQHGIL